MASKTGIANTALRRLGISQKIVDVETDESTEATTIKDAYDEARDNVLGDFDWSFAQKYEVLAITTVNPNTAWNVAYRVPADCIHVRDLLQAGLNRSFQPSQEDEIPYDLGNDVTPTTGGIVVFTNHEGPVLHYTSRFADEGFFSAAFASALAYRLAMETASALSADPNAFDRMETKYNLEIDRAKQRAANEINAKPDPKPSSVRARA